jgi:hypothetical protein
MGHRPLPRSFPAGLLLQRRGGLRGDVRRLLSLSRGRSIVFRSRTRETAPRSGLPPRRLVFSDFSARLWVGEDAIEKRIHAFNVDTPSREVRVSSIHAVVLEHPPFHRSSLHRIKHTLGLSLLLGSIISKRGAVLIPFYNTRATTLAYLILALDLDFKQREFNKLLHIG